MPQTTNLSYFANQKKQESDKSSKIKRTSNNSIVLDILIVFAIVIVISVGLRLLNDFVINPSHTGQTLNPFAINAAIAAEPTDTAAFFNQSHTYVNIKPNQGFTFILTFKNTGDSTWTNENVYLKSSTTALKFRHDFWPDPYLPAQLQEEVVPPGEYGNFKFALQAPPNLGLYEGNFLLVNNNVLIHGGHSAVKMNVVTDPNSVAPKVVTTDPTPVPTQPAPNIPLASQSCTVEFRIAATLDGTEGVDNYACKDHYGLPADGPEMRVGLFHTEEMTTMKNTHDWTVLDEDGTLLASFPPSVEVGFFYDQPRAEYSFVYDGVTTRTAKYLQMKNPHPDGMWTVTSYHNSPSYNPAIDYNDFIGDFEYRYNDSRERTWLIEILPMNTYLKGIQETTNYDPIEYLKTMSVAARTYAMYHYDRNTKHDDEFYHVDSRFDQVYKGYVSMLIFPRVGEAVDATRGIVGTYENKIIVAPYFSRSDGRTRSFGEVWNGDVDYLISVPTPYTEGRELFGHGVGIDATDALHRADLDGWKYDQLLKYYYTGIDLERFY